jgi:hypothetical protein
MVLLPPPGVGLRELEYKIKLEKIYINKKNTLGRKNIKCTFGP